MAKQEQIKKALQKKFSNKNEYNFDDFFDIMQDYGFILWDNNTNYKNEMKKIFDGFVMNDDGFVSRDDIVRDLPDIIIASMNPDNTNNDDSDYKSIDVAGPTENNAFYVHEINALVCYVSDNMLDI